jgi:hypothetical protein
MHYGALRDQAQLVFEHPFRERLAEHRPLVLDAEPAADLGAISFGRLSRAVKLPTLMWTIPVVTLAAIVTRKGTRQFSCARVCSFKRVMLPFLSA